MGNCYSGAEYDDGNGGTSINLADDIKEKLKAITFRQNKINFKSKSEILNEYKVIKQLGSGLFSRVYLAENRDGVKVAIKMIKKKNFVTKETIQKILIEKEILKLIDHVNVLKLYKTMQTHSRIYFVLELAPKGNLLNVLNIRKRLSVEEIRVISAQIISALLYMHSKGIIYGDLKAENILLDDKGIVKLCDFNLSGTKSILNETLQGTVCYIAPEIIEGRNRTPKSDFWSLGVLVYLLFFRKYPFKNTNQTELFFNIINRNIEMDISSNKAPNSFKQFILSLLTKNPNKRIGNNIQEFVKHPFFKNFDWAHFYSNPDNFNYILGIPSLDCERDSFISKSSENELNTIKETQTDKFIYNIEDFTYENKDELIGVTTSKDDKGNMSIPEALGGEDSDDERDDGKKASN